MDRIRINTGEKRIEVNDSGEYITLNFNDQSLLPRFVRLKERFEALGDRAEDDMKRITQEYPEGSDSRMKAESEYNEKVHREIMSEVNAVLGDSACQKIFGDIVPSFEMYGDLFEQLMPYFQKYAKERADKMSKYSAMRTGNV